MPSDRHEERLDTVKDLLLDSGARSVLDLGCGTGELLTRLMLEQQFEKIVGVDSSIVAIEVAKREVGKAAAGSDNRLRFFHTSYTHYDERLRGFDAAALVETIEHIEPDRLSSLESAVFRCYRPKTVVITTPNRDCNPLQGVPDERFRHRDHRFEWNRERFEIWAGGVAARNGYTVAFRGIGPHHRRFGAPTQMAVLHWRGTGGR